MRILISFKGYDKYVRRINRKKETGLYYVYTGLYYMYTGLYYMYGGFRDK
jgi:hypothetical protein